MSGRRRLSLMMLGLLSATFLRAAAQDPPVQLTAQQDRQRLMDILHIASIPPGASGQNPNLDEAIANPFPKLPDPLLLKNGRSVTAPEMWWNERRPEILEDFEREIYGRTPKSTPKVTWEITNTTNDSTTITKQLLGHVDNSSYPLINVNIQVSLTIPANAATPVPIIMQLIGGSGPPRGGAASPPEPTWQEQVLSRSWGYATINTSSIQADNGAGLTQGIIGLVNKGQPRKVDDWGALAAWAWGASRALDYFATDKAVDPKRVGLEGHSRWGKATILAMALDQRFAIAYVSSSGAGGVKLHRRNLGELVENVAAANEYHWMAGNYLKYAGDWDDIPVDSHELVALCAPRPVFIGAGATNGGDGWVDPKGMFMAAASAASVYRLLGKKDMGTAEFPPIETSLIEGDIAFRQHSGGHTDRPNWPTFLKFAERYLRTVVR